MQGSASGLSHVGAAGDRNALHPRAAGDRPVRRLRTRNVSEAPITRQAVRQIWSLRVQYAQGLLRPRQVLGTRSQTDKEYLQNWKI